MKRKFLGAILGLLALIVVFTSSALADGGKKSGLFTYEIKGNGTAVITEFDWKSNGNEDIYIPRMVDGYTVTEIAEKAFAYDDDYPEKDIVVIIPDTIITINTFAFYNAPIASVTLPASVQYIGDGAFANCNRIQKYIVDGANPTYATIDGVLYNKTNKVLVAYPLSKGEEILIPEGIKSIASYAFYYDHPAPHYFRIKVEFPKTLESIGDYAFFGSEFGGNGLILPESIGKIGTGAFANSELSGVDLSATKIDTIPASCFEGATIIYRFLFPMNTLRIEDKAFCNMEYRILSSSDKWFTIPKTVEYIGDKAFMGADFVERNWSGETPELSHLSELKEIGDYAFADIEYSYEVLQLPSNLERIGEHAFDCRVDAGLILNFGIDGFDWGEEIESMIEIGENCHSYSCDLNTIILSPSVNSIGDGLCDRTKVTLQVEPGSYAAVYASQNGYMTQGAGSDDTSWLNS